MMDLMGQLISGVVLETGDVLRFIWVNKESVAAKWNERILDVWHNEHLSSF